MLFPPEQSVPVSIHVELEQKAALCVALIHGCVNPRTKRFLRLLAVDLMVEAEKQRRAVAERQASKVPLASL